MPKVIQLNTPFIFIIAILAVAFALAYWQYRSTVPMISNIQKYLLIFLRFLTTFLLLFILFKPVMKIKYQKKYIPKTEVYIDNSLSMASVDSAANPEHRLTAIVKKLSALDNVDFYTFNSKVERIELNKGFEFNGSTNFDRIFSKLNNTQAEQALIISDGYVTEGGYPKQMEAGREVKLFTLGTNQEQFQQDIFIDQVDFEPLAYLNEQQVIRVKIGSHRLTDKTPVNIRLMILGKAVSSKKAILDTDNAFQNIDFKYIPHRLGLTKIQVSIENTLRNSEDLNNTRSFTTTILKKKLNVAIYGSSADYDGKFIYQILSSEPDIVCQYFIERPDGTYGPGMNTRLKTDPDILILQNYPGPGTPVRNLKYIENLILNRKSSLLLLVGKSSHLNKLSALEPFLPFSKLSITGEEMEGANYLTEPDPLVDLFGRDQKNQDFWKSIPPLFLLKNELPLKPDATTLIRSGKRPIMVQFKKNGYRNITLIGRGFWRWHFLLQDKLDLVTGYRQLLKNSLRWLADKEEMKQVQLFVLSEKATPGYPVKLRGLLYDASFKPIADGQIQIKVKSSQSENQILAQTDSSGAYQAEFNAISEGRIMFIAEGFRDQISLGTDSVEVEVLPLEKEFQYSGVNESYLKNIAENYGGRYFQPGQIDSLVQILKPSSQTITVERQFDLWYHFYIFLIILASILAEWVLRKRFGLI